MPNTIDSKSISYQLLDNDGNVVVTAGFRQGSGTEVVSLPNGNVVTRIQPGKSFTSEPTVIQIPSGTPDELTVRLSIGDIYYHHGKEDEVQINKRGQSEIKSHVITRSSSRPPLPAAN